MFTGIAPSVNGRLGTIAQRVAVNENAIETVAAAVKTVNDKILSNEEKRHQTPAELMQWKQEEHKC